MRADRKSRGTRSKFDRGRAEIYRCAVAGVRQFSLRRCGRFSIVAEKPITGCPTKEPTTFVMFIISHFFFVIDAKTLDLYLCIYIRIYESKNLKTYPHNIQVKSKRLFFESYFIYFIIYFI